MSFTLMSVELKNIRAHEYLLFEPAVEGITAIGGDNGAGKSTIVDAFAWSLYGTRPSGIKNRNLIREGVDPKTKPVSVKSVLIIGGLEYVIERKIITASGTSECNVWGKQKEGELTHVAGPAVSHVEKFIRTELGMNEKGFLTSVLIQQKQVDQIVSASPRERGAVIEELTGIASITQAIQKTNENTRALEKAASIFTIGNIDEVKEKVDKQGNICSELEVKEQTAIKGFNELKQEYMNLKENLKTESAKVDQRIKLNNKVEQMKIQIAFLKKQSEDDLKYILDFKNKYGRTIHIDTKEMTVKVNAKRQEHFNLENKIKQDNNELKSITDNIEKCKVLKSPYEQIKKAEQSLSNLNEILEETIASLDKNKNNKSRLISEIKHSQEAYEHIEGEHKSCPVCKSEIKDPEQLRNEIMSDIEDFQKEQVEVNENIKELIAKEKEIKENITKTNVAIEAIKEENKLKEKLAQLTKDIKNSEKEKSMIDTDLKILETEYEKALRVEADKNVLEAAKSRSLTVNVSIDKAQLAADQATEQIGKLEALSDRSLQGLITKAENAQNRLTRMSLSGKEIRGRRTLELERLEDYKKNLKDVEEAMKRYNEIAEQIDISTSASVMLATFKADRIEQSIPTLEFFASDFLSKFTGGAFTKLTVDEKFNTFVTTSSGVVRPVAQLSGGELSSAAIALRLGIAMLLNSSEKNVLILDEVLVSMDEERSRQIMETIGSMTNSQVIFIAHNSDINSVADKTVMIQR